MINPTESSKRISRKIMFVFQYCGMFCPGPRESVKRLCQQAKRVLAQMRGSGTQS